MNCCDRLVAVAAAAASNAPPSGLAADNPKPTHQAEAIHQIHPKRRRSRQKLVLTTGSLFRRRLGGCAGGGRRGRGSGSGRRCRAAAAAGSRCRTTSGILPGGRFVPFTSVVRYVKARAFEDQTRPPTHPAFHLAFAPTSFGNTVPWGRPYAPGRSSIARIQRHDHISDRNTRRSA